MGNLKTKVSILIVFSILVSTFLLSTVRVNAETYPYVIEQVYTTDISGNVKTQFRRGEFVVVQVKLKAPTTYYYYYYAMPSYLLIVEAFTPQVEVLALGFTTGTLSAGATATTGYGFKIPSDAPLGEYTIKVFVWNGWISQMGANWKALAEPVTITITIIP